MAISGLTLGAQRDLTNDMLVKGIILINHGIGVVFLGIQLLRWKLFKLILMKHGIGIIFL